MQHEMTRTGLQHNVGLLALHDDGREGSVRRHPQGDRNHRAHPLHQVRPLPTQGTGASGGSLQKSRGAEVGL